jgi:hypothetical protein
MADILEKRIVIKLNDAVVMERHKVKVSYRFASLEKLNDNVDMERVWGNIKCHNLI